MISVPEFDTTIIFKYTFNSVKTRPSARNVSFLLSSLDCSCSLLANLECNSSTVSAILVDDSNKVVNYLFEMQVHKPGRL